MNLTLGASETNPGADRLRVAPDIAEAFHNHMKKFCRQTVIYLYFRRYIQVDLNIASEIQINDRLAAELFHMVVEGLSNIRRHTQAVRAGIGLRCAEGQVHLTVENDGIGNGNGNGGGHRVDPLFVPHSLSGRTQALGGEIKVESRGDGGTIVRIDIPL